MSTKEKHKVWHLQIKLTFSYLCYTPTFFSSIELLNLKTSVTQLQPYFAQWGATQNCSRIYAMMLIMTNSSALYVYVTLLIRCRYVWTIYDIVHAFKNNFIKDINEIDRFTYKLTISLRAPLMGDKSNPSVVRSARRGGSSVTTPSQKFSATYQYLCWGFRWFSVVMLGLYSIT